MIEQNNRDPRMASQQLVEQFGQLRLRETAVAMAGKNINHYRFSAQRRQILRHLLHNRPGHRQVVSVQPAGVQFEIIGDQLERFRHVPALAIKIKRVGIMLNRRPFIKPEHRFRFYLSEKPQAMHGNIEQRRVNNNIVLIISQFINNIAGNVMIKFSQKIGGRNRFSFINIADPRVITHHLAIRGRQQEINDIA